MKVETYAISEDVPLPERSAERVHYTLSTPVHAFDEVRSVAEWAWHLERNPNALLRHLNTFTDLPPEIILGIPKRARVCPTIEPGAPRSWTWDALPWEADRWAQDWVKKHPGGASLQEVGNALGITREAVRQVEARVYSKLRKGVERDGESIEEMLKVLREVRDRRAEVLP